MTQTMIDQCVILCGGIGSRLGELTRTTPKPLLPVDNVPFLGRLLQEVARQGVRRVLLLAAFESDQIRAFAADPRFSRDLGITVEIAIEPERAGTGGAVWHARERLADLFFLMNGDSWFDVLLADVAGALLDSPSNIGALSLRRIDDASRYGVVDFDGTRIHGFRVRQDEGGPGLINGGVYAFRKAVIDRIQPSGSLEQDVLPSLAGEGRLGGRIFDGFFIDIGVPESYEAAQTSVPAHQTRPAIFLDRDGVLNHDHGYVGRSEDFDWIAGAREAVRAANEAGYFVFVVTNQAGIGHGYYTEADFRSLMAHVQSELAKVSAHIDDFRHSPFHPEARVEAFRRESDWRKPGPGMILDLLSHWPVDIGRSFLVGDRASDIEAAERAGIRGFLFDGSDLLAFLRRATPFAAAVTVPGGRIS